MNQQIAEIQEAALRDLYERVKQMAECMNGTSTEAAIPSALPDQMCDGRSNLEVTVLHVEVPNGLMVDFKPQNPLGLGSALSVLARRSLPSGVLSDIGFSFVNGEWQSVGKTLTDEVIRECLTPKGPVPIY